MEFTRRDFLRMSATASLLCPLSSLSFLKETEAAETSPFDFSKEKKVPLACRMCAQSCPLFATVLDERLVRIEANPNTPYAGACGRARAAISALYSPNRIKSPLIRVGERGEGKFRKASWDEALDLVAKKMVQLRETGEARSVAYLPRFNSAPGMDKEFFALYGTPNNVGYGDSCFGNALQVGLGAVCGAKLEKGVPAAGTTATSTDYEKAAYGLLVGRNPGGGLVTYTWGVSFGRGRKNGMKITVVDPRKPSEAGESDTEWLPIRPGTDAAFLLALMNVILEKGYYDAPYLLKHSNAPMLVDLATGMPVKTREKVVKDAKPGQEPELDYLVHDHVKGFIFAADTAAPALLGDYQLEQDGKTIHAKTALQYLLDESRQFTPAWAEKVCDVPAARIVAVAEKLNQNKPKVFIDRGYRSERYASSLREKITISTLNVLLGGFGVEGGTLWNRTAHLKGVMSVEKPKDESIMGWYMKHDPDLKMASASHYRRVYARAILEGKPYPSKLAFFYGQNIVGGSSGGSEIAEALKKLEMVVAVSPFFNETTLFADVILPDATFMERDEALNDTGYKSPVPTIGVNRAAIAPLFDTKDGYWIISQLAKRVLKPEEYQKAFGPYLEKGIRGIWEKQLSAIEGISDEEKAGISLAGILEKGVWTGKKKYGVSSKGTPTGKLEIYSLYLAKAFNELKEKKYARLDQASPLPRWTPPFWMEQKKALSGDEFIPITGFSPLSSFTGAQTKDNILLKTLGDQLDWDAVFINKGKGQKLKLKSGDLVEIINPLKPQLTSTAKVVLSETVHPDALFCYYGIGAGHYTGLTALLTNAAKTGFNPNHVSSLNFSPLTGGMPSQDFIVTIRRV
jgi:anaerobic selenocysteine-containing dehydrogenase